MKNVLIVCSLDGLLNELIPKIKSHDKNIKINIFSDTKFFGKNDVEHIEYSKTHFGWYNKNFELDEDFSNILNKMKEFEYMAMRCYDKMEKISLLNRFEQFIFQKKKLSFSLFKSIKLTFQERRLIYLKHIVFWLSFLKKKKIDTVTFVWVPHVSADYVIYGLCKILKIKTIILEQCSFLNRFYAHSDLISYSSEFVKKLKNTKSNFKNKRLSLYSEKYIKWLMSPKPHPDWYMKDETFGGFTLHLFGKKIFIKFLKGIIQFFKGKTKINFVLRNLMLETQTKFLNKELKLNYKRLSNLPDFSKKFIYFPLHVQPEMSTTPLADQFVDQFNIIEILSASVPNNVYIFVKEHPAQLSFGRSSIEYLAFSNLKNVKIVDMNTDTFDLIDKSIAVATCTGTAGFEALFKRKPVLFFSKYNVFSYAPGGFIISSVKDCKMALKKIVKGVKVEIRKLKQFVINVESISESGNINGIEHNLKRIGITKKENLENISKVILNELFQK